MPKIDKWFQHEGLDRTHTLVVMLDQLLGFPSTSPLDDSELHPSIWNDECQELLRKATENLVELYQKIAVWEESEEKV